MICTVALAGCQATYPEIDGTYIEDKAATLAYARKHFPIDSEGIKAYENGPSIMVVIDGNVLSKQFQGKSIRYEQPDSKSFEHRVRFKRVDASTFRFRYPYDQESDAFVILEDDGIWLTTPGKPDQRIKLKKQKNQQVDDGGGQAP